MTDDLSEFHDVFFEEADELIESMEAELLEMLSDPDDAERVNTVFRAAHSIKGGSATFGFDAVAKFTHVMETLLDEVREGHKEADQVLVDLLLRATDCLRAMVSAAKGESEADQNQIDTLLAEMETMLAAEASDAPDGAEVAAAAVPESAEVSDGPDEPGWRIHLKPGADSLKTANDPLGILTELSRLGEVSCELLTDDLPEFADIDPTSLYLAWRIELHGAVEESAIREVFEWIDVCSDIQIERMGQAAGSGDAVSAAAPSTPEPVAAASDTPAPLAPKRDSAAAAPKAKPKAAQVTSIRVGIDKIDKLINLVGELVITQSVLHEEGLKLSQDIGEQLQEGLSQLQRHTRELQENVMQIRMVPISNAFNRLPRMIHDLTSKLGKRVELVMSGEQTELDKTVLESIGDPLVHLVRNAVDHGIEMPEAREAKGKDPEGKVFLNAYHESGNIVIEIRDDGAGIDRDRVLSKAIDKGLVSPDEQLTDGQVFELLFHPGFSTAEQVSDVSGRGVGMDVVKRNIHSLGGAVEVQSRLGQGSVFTIRLPLTLAIVEGQLVRVEQQTYVIPVISIVESIQVDQRLVSSIAEQGEVYRLRDEYIPVARLSELFSLKRAKCKEQLMVVVESDFTKVGLLIDELMAQQQVVIKSLEANYKQVPGIAGGTILGDGTVSLILDINGVIAMSRGAGDDSRAA